MNQAASWKTLPLFLLACYLTASLGAMFVPGPWYDDLNRAPWNPPNIAFPIVWTVLYFLIAIAGWKIFASPESRLKQLWVIQLVLNGAWSWIFFGQQWVGMALVDIVMLDIFVTVLLVGCWRKKLRLAGWLLLPYLLWVLLATSLNAYIFLMN